MYRRGFLYTLSANYNSMVERLIVAKGLREKWKKDYYRSGECERTRREETKLKRAQLIVAILTEAVHDIF